MVATAVVLISRQAEPELGRDRADAHGPIEDRPAALAPVANQPLLRHVLDSFAELELEDVVLAADAPLAPQVEEAVANGNSWGFRLNQLAIERLTLGSAISATERLLGPRPILVHHGDSLCRGLGHLLSSSQPGERDGLLLVEEHSPPGGTIIRLADGRPPELPGLGAPGADWSPLGVSVFGSGIGDAARSVQPSVNHDFELLAAALELCSESGRLETRAAAEWFRLRGQRGALLEANRFALEGIQRDVPDGTISNGSVVQGAVAIDPTARLESTVVRGPAVIGPRVRLTDAYVGPYTSIAEDVLIDGAEVEHSIILSGTRICHLGNRLEGSVIGANARVFRDFRLPNALRLSIGDGAEVSVH